MMAMIDDQKHIVIHCVYSTAKLLRNVTNAVQRLSSPLNLLTRSGGTHITLFVVYIMVKASVEAKE